MNAKKLSELAKLLQQNDDGTLKGGFSIISAVQNSLIIGGEESNNCSGGNCVQGCGVTNNYAGCGGALNFSAGCGTTQN